MGSFALLENMLQPPRPPPPTKTKKDSLPNTPLRPERPESLLHRSRLHCRCQPLLFSMFRVGTSLRGALRTQLDAGGRGASVAETLGQGLSQGRVDVCLVVEICSTQGHPKCFQVALSMVRKKEEAISILWHLRFTVDSKCQR